MICKKIIVLITNCRFKKSGELFRASVIYLYVNLHGSSHECFGWESIWSSLVEFPPSSYPVVIKCSITFLWLGIPFRDPGYRIKILWENKNLHDVGVKLFRPLLYTSLTLSPHADNRKKRWTCKAWSHGLWKTFGWSSMGHGKLVIFYLASYFLTLYLSWVLTKAFVLMTRMMLLGVLNTMPIKQKLLMLNKRLQLPFLWRHSSVMFSGSPLVLLD